MYECPPNGQGLTTLVALGILDQLQNQGKVGDLAQVKHNSAEYLHALIEALRLAFADTRYHVSDPHHSQHDVAALLLKPEYLAERARLFDPKKASAELEKGRMIVMASLATSPMHLPEKHIEARGLRLPVMLAWKPWETV